MSGASLDGSNEMSPKGKLCLYLAAVFVCGVVFVSGVLGPFGVLFLVFGYGCVDHALGWAAVVWRHRSRVRTLVAVVCGGWIALILTNCLRAASGGDFPLAIAAAIGVAAGGVFTALRLRRARSGSDSDDEKSKR